MSERPEQWLGRHQSGRHGAFAGAAEGFWQLHLDAVALDQKHCPTCGERRGRPSLWRRLHLISCVDRWHRVHGQ